MNTHTRRVRTAGEQRNRKKAKQNTGRGFGQSSRKTSPQPSQASNQAAGLAETKNTPEGWVKNRVSFSLEQQWPWAILRENLLFKTGLSLSLGSRGKTQEEYEVSLGDS